MKKNKEREEIQTRREFFKKAAKSVLPIVATVALAGVPNIVRAVEHPSGICDTCTGGCRYTCSAVCNSSCKGGCNNSCYKSCSGSCSGGCSGGCGKSSKY